MKFENLAPTNSTERYGEDFALLDNNGHNLVVEAGRRTTAQTVQSWLAAHGGT